MEPFAAVPIPEELLQRFNRTQANLAHIHASLKQRRGSTITDSSLRELGVSIDKIELSNTSETVTPYFSPCPHGTGADPEEDDYHTESHPSPASYWLTQSLLFHQDKTKWLNVYETPGSHSSGSEGGDSVSGQEDSGFESEDEESSEIEDTSDEDLDHGSEGSEMMMPTNFKDKLLVHKQLGESSDEEESEKESEENREARRKRVKEQRRQARMQEDLRLATRQRYRWNVYQSVSMLQQTEKRSR